MTKKRVVITGMGALTPIGNTVDTYWDSLLKGIGGVDVIDRFDVSDFSTKIGALIKHFNPEDFFDKKEARRSSRFIQYALAAAVEAVKDSGLDIASIGNEVGVEVGSGIGGIEYLEEAAHILAQKGPSRVSPFTVPMMICDMASGVIAIRFGAKGPNACSVTACASAAHSVSNAYRLIQDGDVLAMITGGSESAISPLGLASFCAARSLSVRNDDPKTASRPFDLDRDGFVMGEGAGIVILEEYEHAKARGAHIYAEMVGYGSSGDAYHMTAPAPEGEGAKRAMQLALKRAHIDPKDVDYINAHGTSTDLNDNRETSAIKATFGEHAYTIPISSTKSMTGHLLGAAGAIELIACAKVIQTGWIPPTINQFTPDPACDLNYTPNQAVQASVEVALSNSFGFGGHNGVLVIQKLR